MKTIKDMMEDLGILHFKVCKFHSRNECFPWNEQLHLGSICSHAKAIPPT